MELWSQRQTPNYRYAQQSYWTPNPTETPSLPPGVISASEALEKMQRKRPQRRRRPRPTRMRAQASHQHKKSTKPKEDPNVVFFPTSQTGDSEAKCQDFDSQGNGFNAFAFLSFLLTVFNAVRYINCIVKKLDKTFTIIHTMSETEF